MQKELSIILIIFLVGTLYPQEKIASIGVGLNIKNNDSITYNFSFSFNRTPAVEEDAGPSLKVFQLGKSTIFSLRPSSQVDVGNGVENSPNNLFFDLELEGLSRIHNLKTTNILYEFAPSISADKNFYTGLLYSSLGVKLLYYNYPSDYAFYVLPGINFDLVRRVVKGTSPYGSFRIDGTLDFNLKIKKLINFTILSKLFYIRNDASVIANGTYGNLTASIDFKFPFYNKLGLSAKYSIGYDQPLYKKVNSISFGISLFK
jgi:hypothetical protein